MGTGGYLPLRVLVSTGQRACPLISSLLLLFQDSCPSSMLDAGPFSVRWQGGVTGPVITGHSYSGPVTAPFLPVDLGIIFLQAGQEMGAPS